MKFTAIHPRWVWSVALLLLCACSALQAPAPQPIASDNDDRLYRYLRLDNELRVLLVSDPGTEKAAASLDVNVGSRQDPPDREGLAHFLEHMLFLGTKEYPRAGEYQDFIAAHGGSHNAFTAFEHTNYFFDIDSGKLEPTLDRFAQFFVAPLFTEAYVDREKNAVHSEYLANIKDDARKGLDVFKEVVNPAHPFSQFSVGSLETLADRDGQRVQDDLLSFYQQHYSANLMTLVVYGKESLDELEQMVRPRFAKVPNHDRESAPIAEPLFAGAALPMVVAVRPEQEVRLLTITFPLPDVEAFYREKPLHYIGNILGHEGEGSLLSWLKRNNWATALGAGEGLSYQGGTTFNVTVELTQEGEKNYPTIAAAIYELLALTREQGIQEWMFDEQQHIAEQHFRFQERSQPIHYASTLAMGMHQYPVHDVLRGHYAMDRYDPALIAKMLGYFTVDNSMITLTAPNVSTDKASIKYGTAYGVTRLPDAQRAMISAYQLDATVTLPKPNPFVADNIALKALTGESKVPERMVDEPGLHVWYKQEESFRVPRGNIEIGIRSPLLSDGPKPVVLTELFARVLGDELNEYSYPATLAGLQFSVRKHMRGLSISVSGFDQKQPLLLQEILTEFLRNDIDAQRFERIAAHYRRELENRAKQSPYELLVADLPELLYRHRWPEDELLQVVDEVDHQQLENFADAMLKGLDIEVLIHGNYARAEAEQIVMLLRDTLHRASQPAVVPRVEVLRIAAPLRRAVVSDHADASGLLYVQAVDIDKTSRVALGLSTHMLSADFYNNLRTEQQLGYIVMAGPYPTWDVPGMLYLIQSPVLDAEGLRRAIDSFVRDWAAQPEPRLRALFDTHKQAMAQRLAERPKNLAESSERYWADIAQRYYNFDSREQLLGALQALDYETWRKLFDRDVVTGSRQLYLYTLGKFGGGTGLNGTPIDNVTAFKAGQAYYRFD